MPAEQLAAIFEVLEGGAEVSAGNIVQFPVDAAGSAAETSLAGEGITTMAKLGNGTATEISQLTATGAGGAATTTGLGILAMDVGAAGAAIAPALGILAGVGLYNLAPEFWTNVSNALISAGQTVGGKVRTFLNSATKQVGFSQTTIEIFKNAFLEAGLFDGTYDPTIDNSGVTASPKYISSFTVVELSQTNARMTSLANRTLSDFIGSGYIFGDESATQQLVNGKFSEALTSLLSQSLDLTGCVGALCSCVFHADRTSGGVQHNPTVIYMDITYYKNDQQIFYTSDPFYNKALGLNYRCPQKKVVLQTSWGNWYIRDYPDSNYNIATFRQEHPIMKGSNSNPILDSLIEAYIGWNTSSTLFQPFFVGYDLGLGVMLPGQNVQPGATVPTSDPISTTYPNWIPWTSTPTVPLPSYNIYPVEIPVNNPDPDQSQAQNPNPNPDPDPFLQWIIDTAINPAPNPSPTPDPSPDPEPEPDPDLDPQPEPEPLPDIAEKDPDPDPPDPNPDPIPGPLPIIPDLPDTVDSNAMFTVYRPSLSQLNDFGGWLWSSSIIEQILRMWQNPLDGIIALMKVYAEPTVGSTQTIQVGYLASSASAPIVTSQFVTVNCGTINVSETKHNATDYTPYVSLHLYLPFIGIVELDPNEFMNGSITVKYSIDVYTGTCLAEVKATRSEDMPNATIIYTFSGNAAQQLPLTSSNFAGALSSLVSAVGGGIAIASGGGLGSVAGALAIGHSLTHEMVHVGHSGALSANAGIMASRKPYIIIGRRHGYDANSYNELYGYPVNKTVYLGNCSGFTRVKACRLKSKASENEKQEIEALLKKGVIF